MGRDGDLRVGISPTERNPFVEDQRVGLQVVIRLGFFVFLEGGQRSFRRREIEAGPTSGNSSRMDGV
jgi:hypothetical protein